jgi:pyruvate dehydrogenase complex dehydrogenase (E1) component
MESNMVATKKVVHRQKAAPSPPPPAPSAATKSFPTAALGLGMVVLTNYQAEVKQALALLLKTFT